MDEKTHEQENRDQQSIENPLNGVLLDRNLEVSDDPHPIQAVIQKNEDCLEVMNGFTERGNVVSFHGVGGAVIFWFSLGAISIGLSSLLLVTILILLTVFVFIPLVLGRTLESNFRLNRKTNKLYAVDNKTFEPISCDLDKVTIHKFQNFRMSARGVSRDFNLAFSGKDETTGKEFSFPTPAVSNEEHSIDNWEYFRRFMSGQSLGEISYEYQGSPLLGRSFRGQMKKRFNWWFMNLGFTPLKNRLVRIKLNIKNLQPIKLIGNILFLFFPFLGLLLSILLLPGDILETWAYFYWKKHPEFTKENDELCGFSETSTSH